MKIVGLPAAMDRGVGPRSWSRPRPAAGVVIQSSWLSSASREAPFSLSQGTGLTGEVRQITGRRTGGAYQYGVVEAARLAGVYLLSPHPVVLEEVPRWCPEASFERVLVSPCSTLSREWVRGARRALCVVDACFPPDVSESFVSALMRAYHGVRTIVLTADLKEASAVPLLKLGVKGLLTYDQARQSLLPALKAVASGGTWAPRHLLSRVLDALVARSGALVSPSPQGLSRREAEVFALVLENLSNKQIADRLSISERTVKFHVSNLLAKFSVSRRTQLLLKSRQASFEAR